MDISFENSVVYEGETEFVPEIDKGIRLSDSNDNCAKALLEAIEAARENGDE